MTPHYRKLAIARLRLVRVEPGAFTPEQAAQINAWRAENEAAIQAEMKQ
jgi:hypothetical protein